MSVSLAMHLPSRTVLTLTGKFINHQLVVLLGHLLLVRWPSRHRLPEKSPEKFLKRVHSLSFSCVASFFERENFRDSNSQTIFKFWKFEACNHYSNESSESLLAIDISIRDI